MLEILDCPPGDFLLDIAAGQPFRLRLWHRLAAFLRGPDADFLLQLPQGVHLGVNQPLTPSPAWPQHSGTLTEEVPLQNCLDSWKSAQDHPDIVRSLIQEELDAGFIAHVPAGVAELEQLYSKTAIGKLGVVLAPGRSPRLILTAQSVWLQPIQSCLTICYCHVFPMWFNVPLIVWLVNRWHNSPSTWQKHMAEFWFNQTMVVCIVSTPMVNFTDALPSTLGPMQAAGIGEDWRASWYAPATICWPMDMHALWQYVDDLLAWLDKSSSPLWASLIVVLLLILGVPMSWHKAALSDTVDWIGWRISVSSWTIEVPSQRLDRITAQIRSILISARLTLRDLQSLVGRLLWLTSAWRRLRPLLIPLYKALHRIPITMLGMDHVTFQALTAQLDDRLQLLTQLTHKHQSLRKGVTLSRVANVNVYTLTDAEALHLKSRRVWVGISDPTTPNRKLDDEATETLNIWLQLLVSTPFSLSMCPPDWIQVNATADAMASQSMAGLWGAAIFPDGSSAWFQFRISLAEAQSLWPWLGDDMQKHIAAWELLAQFALSFCIESHLPHTRGPIACHQATDNSAADAASAKGLTMTPALVAVLTPYFKFMRRYQVYPHITRIPGRLNVLADEMSRFKDTLSIELDTASKMTVPWMELLQTSGIVITQAGRKWPSHFDIHQRGKGLLQSADWVLPSISFWGEFTLRLVDGRFVWLVSV